jgi:hypothetical protein
LKCNQGLPCESCIKRNKQASCQYAPNANRNKAGIPSKQAQLKEKLKNLEEVVSSLLAQQSAPYAGGSRSGENTQSGEEHLHPSLRQASSATAFSTFSGASAAKEDVIDKESPRALMGEDGQVHYVNASHWLSVLEEIKEVRETLPVDEGAIVHADLVKSDLTPDIGFPFTQTEALDIDEILASLPPPATCHTLLSAFFNAGHAVPGMPPIVYLARPTLCLTPGLGIIHPDKFRHEVGRPLSLGGRSRADQQ